MSNNEIIKVDFTLLTKLLTEVQLLYDLRNELRESGQGVNLSLDKQVSKVAASANALILQGIKGSL